MGMINHNKYPIERIDLILNKLKEKWLMTPNINFSELIKNNISLLSASDSDVLKHLGFEPREYLLWGTYGKNATDPLKYVFIKDLESDHIKNILNIEFQGDNYESINIRNELVKELQRRKIDYIL